MLRKVIKIDEDGNDMVNEDGSYIFEEVEISDLSNNDPKEPPENVEPPKNVENLQQGLSDEQITKIAEQIQKKLNLSEPLKKIEKPIEYPDEKTISSGFNKSWLAKGGKK